MFNLQMRNDIYISTFDNKVDLKHKILQLIMNQEANKIIYKGSPRDIKYKLLKKIIPAENDKSEINKIISIDKSKTIRENFNTFIDKIGEKPCLIYKK